MKKIVAALLLAVSGLPAAGPLVQAQPIYYRVNVTRIYHTEDPCWNFWEFQPYEYRSKIWVISTADGTWSGGDCRGYNSSSDNLDWDVEDYTIGASDNARYRYFHFYMQGWEEDTGGDCTMDSGDDCRWEGYTLYDYDIMGVPQNQWSGDSGWIPGDGKGHKFKFKVFWRYVAPNAPTVIAPSGIGLTSFNARWNTPGDSWVQGYRIDVSTNSNFSTMLPGYNNLDVGNVTSFTVSGLTQGVMHYYRVRAYNYSGAGPNSSAQTVRLQNVLPQMDSIANRTTADGRGLSVPFTISDAETPASSLTVAVSSSNTDLFPNANMLLIPGAGNRKLNLSPVPGLTGTATITLTVTDADGGTASRSFTITVNQVNRYPGAAGSGAALEFDGVDDYVQTPVTDLSGTAITIEYWFRGANLHSAVRQQSGSHYIVAGYNGSHVLSFDGGLDNPLTAGWPGGDQWHHVAMTWTQNTVNGFASYLDGKLVARRNSANTSIPNLATNLLFGSRFGLDQFTTGALDEVRIWRVVRTPAEIEANRYTRLTGSEPGLVAYYRFDEGFGESPVDASPNGFHATLMPPKAGPVYGQGISHGLSLTYWKNSPLNLILPGGYRTGTNIVGRGGLLREIYTGASSTIASLTSAAGYPNQPAGRDLWLNGAATPVNIAEQYGQRLRGWIVPPVSGNYTFYISSDDQSELWLSTDSAVANRQKIAWVTSYTSPEQWTKESVQKSAAKALVEGQRYYIEILHAEGGGGDHLAVKWDRPDGITESPIPAVRFIPWGQVDGVYGDVIVTPPSFGTLVQNGANLVYYPNPGYSGPDQFTYRTERNSLQSAVATVSLNGRIVPDKPVALGNMTMHFDGTNDSLRAGGGWIDLAGKSFTLECWARRDNATSAGYLISQGAGAVNRGLFLGFSSATAYFGFWGNDLGTPAVYTNLGWNHYAAVYDATTKTRKLYVNGLLAATDAAASDYLGSGPIHIGSRFGTSDFFGGSINDVRIWTIARSESDIKRDMQVILTGAEFGLASYYRFAEGAGPVVHDAAAGQRHAAALDNPMWEDYVDALPGITNRNSNWLGFDGLDDTVTVQGFTNVNLASGFSIEAWVLRTYRDYNNDAPILTRSTTWNHAGAGEWGLFWGWGNDLLFRANNQEMSCIVPDGMGWHHIAVTHSGTEMKLYVDGALAASRTATNLGHNTLPLRIGSSPRSRSMNGYIGEVRVWNTVRTPSEIQTYQFQQPARGTAGLVASYRLDEERGYLANDPGGVPGITYNGPVWRRLTTSEPPSFLTLPVPEDGSRALYLGGFHMDGKNLQVIIVQHPAHGRLEQINGMWIYTPNPDFAGVDTIAYKVNDGTYESDVISLTLEVEDLNDPPTLSPFLSELVEEEEEPAPISFRIGDVDDPLDSLQLSARSSNPRLIPDGNIVFGGSGSNRTVTLNPQDGEIGKSTIQITVSDGEDSASRTFEYEVVSRLAFAPIDIGMLTGKNAAEAVAVNDQGCAVGSCALNVTGQLASAYFYRGFMVESNLLEVGTLGGTVSFASDINDNNVMVGTSTKADGRQHAFRKDLQKDLTLQDLGVLVGGSESFATAINNAGTMVGAADVAGGRYHPVRQVSGGALTDLGLPAGATDGYAMDINSNGVIVGMAQLSPTSTRAFVYTNGFGYLANPAGVTNTGAKSVNSFGVVVGWGTRTSATAQVVVRWTDGVPSDLGDILGGGEAYAQSINDFGQIVGLAKTTGGVYHAFIYDNNGGAHDINELLPYDSGWVITDARAINNKGVIAANGWYGGQLRACLLYPATQIGRRVYRPPEATTMLPQIQILQGNPDDTMMNSFYWSSYEAKLFAIRPVMAKITWWTSMDPQDTNAPSITTYSFNVWPRHPDLHVAGTPVNVEPNQNEFSYGFFNLSYSTANGANVDPSTKIFKSPNSGWHVIHYLRNEGQVVNPQNQRNYFTIARTIPWNDPNHLVDHVPWTIGNVVTNALHDDWPGLTGYMYRENSFYDGAGPDRAYDRDTRTGAIIPVNLDNANTNDDFIVVWYRRNRIGAAWSGLPVRYDLEWPANAPRIVIASALGSGPLDPVVYSDARLYNQPDRSLPGYNPNEEHAMLAASGSGQALYALRDDLNAIVNASRPFALLKYKDTAANQWRIKVYQVVREEAPYFFRYAGEAGREIQPPMPLSVLPLSTNNYGVSGPYFLDCHNKIYARAAGLNGTDTNIVLRYFYPLQPDFFYDLNNDGTNEVATGENLAWLDRRPGGTSGVPVNVTFDIRWPANTPELALGETLLTSKHGLPDVFNMAMVQVIYDSLDPVLNSPTGSVARLFDPLSTRSVSVAQSFQWPAAIQRQSLGGVDVFPQLPYHIRSRFYYDPSTRRLGFKGIYDTSGSGEPLLLINIMSERDRDRIKSIDGDGTVSAFDTLVENLYQRTRNPNAVDLNRDGTPDAAVLAGLTTNGASVVREAFGAGPKALSAGMANVPPATPVPGDSLNFSSTNGIALPVIPGTQGNFTVCAWVRPSSQNTAPLFTNRIGAAYRFLFQPQPSQGRILVSDRPAISSAVDTVYADLNIDWQHFAFVRSVDDAELRVYVDGVLVGSAPSHSLETDFTGLRIPPDFRGQVDELQIWSTARSASDIAAKMHRRLTGREDGLAAYWRFDETSLSNGLRVAREAGGRGYDILAAPALFTKSTAPAAIPDRYVILVENNDPELALPVGLKVIRIANNLYRGELKVIKPDNVFDERLTLRHSGDFGGEPQHVEFEWYYHEDVNGFDPESMPDPDGGTMAGWHRYQPDGYGHNDMTIGDGGQSSLLTLGDNWFVMRYRGYTVNQHGSNVTPWSAWIGDPAATTRPRAMLAEGWVKRVLAGINLYDQRTSNFRDNEVSTIASMIRQAGPRYEGDVALNPDASNLNELGIIEIYQTVLNRARNLSIDGTPAVDFEPANNALLLAANRIADLYMLLGNEAYADASDPTIGFATDSQQYGSMASSIFAFQNQLDSLIEEELCLLRGRDNKTTGVGARPVYNRLFWNFTQGDGEVAYAQVYNMVDANGDGFINELDSKLLYPQGHGDAWGHYLTSVKTYYTLLRHPLYTWTPRAESILLSGVPVTVDYLDERKFASAAAAKARVGAEVLNLTYRNNYVDDPSGQWQGYKDTDAARAWGVVDWARRAGQGAYFDWVTANAIIPPVDRNPDHTGVQIIDRRTVTDLGEIVGQAMHIQSVMDKADEGLSPLGLAKGVVTFDIDPALMDPVNGRQTHFEQIHARAMEAMKNTKLVFDMANRMTSALRMEQGNVQEFSDRIEEQERDYRNRLIEIFGYPYAGTIGAGKTYPEGYIGPDLYQYMYVDNADITGRTAPLTTNLQAFFTPIGFATNFMDILKYSGAGLTNFVQGFVSNYIYAATHFFPGDFRSVKDFVMTSSVLPVDYPVSQGGGYAFVPPVAWGSRRAPGELQLALSEVLQAELRLKTAILNYQAHNAKIQDAIDILDARYQLRTETLRLRDVASGKVMTFKASSVACKLTSKALDFASGQIEATAEITKESLPKMVGLAMDVTCVARGVLTGVKKYANIACKIGSAIAEGGSQAFDALATSVKDNLVLDIETEQYNFEVKQRLKEFEQLLRQEPVLRTEVYRLGEALDQARGEYAAILARGERLIQERISFRQKTAASTQASRYRDMAFRIFRNDALQKYRAQFDLAARYVYLAASAYDYELNLLGNDTGAGRKFFTDIVRQRGLGQIENGLPIAGQPGLADALARMKQNFDVLKPQLGLNNPEDRNDRFSLRAELFRIPRNTADTEANAWWRAKLMESRVADLWNVPEYRRYCRPPGSQTETGPMPGLVIRFPSTILYRLNFFGWPLAAGDSFYLSTRFATKIRSVGVWFENYDTAQLSQTPGVYLVPVGLDVLRSPNATDFSTREWRVLDQRLPIPYPISSSDMARDDWIPVMDTMSGHFSETRRYASFRAYHDALLYDNASFTSDSRLVGRSAWNTEWMLIIPGGDLLYDAGRGLDVFINTISDIRLYFQTYSYAGN